LHSHIQDLFNESGVQIMVPHYEAQPDQRVVFPKSQWFAAPGGEMTMEGGEPA
jgi:hypothetical protein